MKSNNGRLHDRVAFISGGASGIGRACAERFVEEGGKVVIADRSGEGAAVADAIRSKGGQAKFVTMDVTDAESVKAAVADAAASWGGIDCAVNSAGIGAEPALLADQSEEAFDRVIAINLRGVFLCAKYQIQQFLKQGRPASIVNISSGLGVLALPSISPYVASKHGVIGITRAGALDYAAQRIRLNAICPGTIITPMMPQDPAVRDQFAAMTPMGRLGQPEEIADAALWLCSDESSFVTGSVVTVDGGYTVQ